MDSEDLRMLAEHAARRGVSKTNYYPFTYLAEMRPDPEGTPQLWVKTSFHIPNMEVQRVVLAYIEEKLHTGQMRSVRHVNARQAAPNAPLF